MLKVSWSMPWRGGAVPEEADRHVVLLAVLVGEGDAGAEANLSTHDAVATEEVALLVEHVHGAALALARSGLPAVELGHHHFGVGAEGRRVGVVTVGRDDAVRRTDGLHHAGEDRFLADIEMAESAEFLLDVQVTAALLEAAHQQHVAVPLDVGLL